MFQAIGQWISGKDPNKPLRDADRAQNKFNKEQVRATNRYNRKKHKADVENYFAEREYAYETAITNWEYGKQIKDYEYTKALATYEKSQDIYNQQIGFNEQAQTLAISDQQASIQDLALSQAFQREAMHADLMNEIKRGGIQKLGQGAKLYGIKSNRRINSESIQQDLNQATKQNTFEKEAKFVEGLQQSGKAALGQSGVSRKKTLQSTAAESFRSLVALDSSLSGSRNKAAVDLLKVYVDASVGETQVGLDLDMIELGINAAKDEVKYNNKILEANMRSLAGQVGRNIQQIQMQRMQSDLQAEANLNLFPEEFDYAPEPQMLPERTFVEPLELEAPPKVKGPRVATGVEAGFNIVGEVAQLASIVMGGVGAYKSLFAAAPSLSAAASGVKAGFAAGAATDVGIGISPSAANLAGWPGNLNY
jgi:hypothetical protein